MPDQDSKMDKTSERPLISVVMPIFNREEFVAGAIDSILAQTYDHWEIILVDDGSTDRSYEIALSYAARMPEKIRSVTHENRVNRGISASRNRGNSFARGEYIACLDSDDTWVPTRLEEQIKILHQHPEVGLVVGATEYWHPDQRHLDRLILAGGPRDCLVQPPTLFYEMYPLGDGVAPSMNTVLIRKDVVERIGGWEESFRTTYEDQAMLTKVYLTASVYISSNVGDIYRQHAQSIMRTELVGIRYYRKRYLFLLWLKGWLKSKQPGRTAELAVVQRALKDRSLWAFRDPIRYNLWRALVKMGRILGRVTGWSGRT